MNTSIFKRIGLCCMPLAMLQTAGATGIVQPPLKQQATYALPADSFNTLNNEETVSTAVHAAAKQFTDAYIVEHNELLDKIRQQNSSSFQLIRKILTKEGVPAELVYMAVVESKMKNTATSYAGAAGIWQLMPATARTLGLSITAKEDQRRNIYKSTVAAAKYLNDLYEEFDDWLLAIAAYNCGSGNVHKAIKKAGSRDFWKLQYSLPKETREHVKRFIAVLFYYEEYTRDKESMQTKQIQQALIASEQPKQVPTDTPAPQEPQIRWILFTQQEDEWIFIPRK